MSCAFPFMWFKYFYIKSLDRYFFIDYQEPMEKVTMKKGTFLTLLLLVFVLIRCSNDDDVPAFSGITETDRFATITGNIDESDWQLDEVWTNQEAQLFDDVSENALNNNSNTLDFSTLGFSSTLGPAFPNPSNGQVIIQLLDSDFEEGELVIVDNRYNIVLGPASISHSSSGLSINVEVANQSASFFQGTAPEGGANISVSSGQILRVYYYYKLASPAVYLKGHGDILFQ